MKKQHLYLLLFLILILTACRKNHNPDNQDGKTEMEKLNISPSFNWSTTKAAKFKITALDNQDGPIAGAKFFVFSKDPELGGKLIVSGQTNTAGIYEIDYQVPSYYTELYIATNYVGLVSDKTVQLSAGGFETIFGGSAPAASDKSVLISDATNANYKYLGTYNAQGVPNYLEEQNEEISASFLEDINNTLPERVKLPISHPEYFKDIYDHNIRLLETCDVWVTFVAEGADYKNVFGFYTYPTNSPPQKPEDIDTITIIFPNASLAGSGGGLKAGNKVKIGRYNANTTIAWALIANGWNGTQVTNGKWIIYSTKELNMLSNPGLNQQTVLLRDPGRQRFLLGIEDIQRTNSGCDHDFNDAVFFVTANPVQAVDPTDLPVVDYTGEDGDGDGVPTQFDDYPDDPTKAFDNHFFTKGDFGTLAFEDLWPYRGDYDFNDAVIDYNFNQITDGLNRVSEIEATFILRAHGAFYHNGFGFSLPISPDYIASVEGNRLTAGYTDQAENGTENGQSTATIIVWDDSYAILPPAGNSIGANTTPDVPFITPDTLVLTIKLKESIALNQVGVPPYNPFIIVDKNRKVEVHLPDHAPTDLADLSLLGSGHDNSIPASGRYYKSSNNLPWALNIVERFEYPVEKVEIPSAYLKFAEWAESSGNSYNDWYKKMEGYRKDENVYVPVNK